MRIAICALDMDVRYSLSRMAEEMLMRRGILPEISLFPMPQELLETSMHGAEGFHLVIVAASRHTSSLEHLCRRVPVILVGKRQDSAAAFDLGASHFLETPVTKENLGKALARCLGGAEERMI